MADAVTSTCDRGRHKPMLLQFESFELDSTSFYRFSLLPSHFTSNCSLDASIVVVQGLKRTESRIPIPSHDERLVFRISISHFSRISPNRREHLRLASIM